MATEGTILRLKKLALIEDASPDNVVNLIPVTEDAEGSALFGVTNEAGNLTIGAGQLYLNRANPELSVICLKPDSSDVTQIESWVDNQTDIYVSGLTIDGGILIGDEQTSTGAVKLVANEQLSDNDIYAFNIQKQSPPGFDPSTGIYQNGFWVGKNLLGGYEWADTDSDNVSNGWDATDFSSTFFSSGQQTLTTDGVSSVDVFVRGIWFPFENQQITFSINVDTFNTIDLFDVRIVGVDASGSGLTNTISSINSTGRASVTHTTGSNIAILRCQVRLDNTTTGTQVSEVISDPALKLGTDSTYTTF